MEQDQTRVPELTAEDLESLKALAESPHWAVYKRFLMRAEVEIRKSASMGTGFDGMIDSWNKNGMASGINFTIVQLQGICANYDARIKKELEKRDKKTEPFRKG